MEKEEQTNKLQAVKNVFETESIKLKFFEMLGKKSTGFIVSVISIIEQNKKFEDVERDSILYAAAAAASMDLPINPNLGLAYIIPYKKKAQFQMGYKGFKQLAMRSGEMKALECEPAYEGDTEETIKKRLTDIIPAPPPSDVKTGYVGYFRLLNGFEKTLYMSIKQLKEHGLKYSQSYKSKVKWISEGSLWNTNFEAMAKKTVTKLLLSKDAPLSIEMQKAISVDQAVLRDFEGNKLEYVDNKKLKLEEVMKIKEEERVGDWIKNSRNEEELQEAESVLFNDELKTLYEEKMKSFVDYA